MDNEDLTPEEMEKYIEQEETMTDKTKRSLLEEKVDKILWVFDAEVRYARDDFEAGKTTTAECGNKLEKIGGIISKQLIQLISQATRKETREEDLREIEKKKQKIYPKQTGYWVDLDDIREYYRTKIGGKG